MGLGTLGTPIMQNKSHSVKLPTITCTPFQGTDLDEWIEEYSRWMRLTGVQNEPKHVKTDLLIENCGPKVRPLIKKLVLEIEDFQQVIVHMGKLFPKMENDLTLRQKLDRIPPLPSMPEPQHVAQLCIEMDEIFGKLSEGAMSDQDKFLALTKKLHPKTFAEMRSDRHYKRRMETYMDLKQAILEKAEEDHVERHLFQLKKENLHTLQEEVQGKSLPKPHEKPHELGKGKGKGKGQGRGKGKGKGMSTQANSDPKPLEQPKFSASIQCKWCGRKGHYDNKCWDKHPEQRPKNFKFKVPKPHASSSSSTPMNESQNEPINSKKRKANVLLFQGVTMTTHAFVNGKPLEAIIDTGATLSVVAKPFVAEACIDKSRVIPVEVGSGQTLFTLGETELVLSLGEKTIRHKAQVLDTNAFEAVLGVDFCKVPGVPEY